MDFLSPRVSKRRNVKTTFWHRETWPVVCLFRRGNALKTFYNRKCSSQLRFWSDLESRARNRGIVISVLQTSARTCKHTVNNTSGYIKSLFPPINGGSVTRSKLLLAGTREHRNVIVNKSTLTYDWQESWFHLKATATQLISRRVMSIWLAIFQALLHNKSNRRRAFETL